MRGGKPEKRRRSDQQQTAARVKAAAVIARKGTTQQEMYNENKNRFIGCDSRRSNSNSRSFTLCNSYAYSVLVGGGDLIEVESGGTEICREKQR